MGKYLKDILKLPAHVKFFLLTEAFLGLGLGMWCLNLNFFLAARGMATQQIGEVVAFGSLVNALFALVGGSWCDKLGYQRGMVLGCFLKAGAMLLTFMVPPGWALYGVRMVDGIGSCLVTVSAYPYVVSLVEGEVQNTVYTLLFAVSMLAQFFGNVTAGMLASGGFSDGIIFLSSTALVAAVALLRRRLPCPVTRGTPEFKWYIPTEPAIQAYLVYETLGYCSYFMAYSMLNLICRNYFGLTEGLTGWVIGLMTLISGVMVLLVPAFTSRFDRMKLNRGIILGLMFLYPMMALCFNRIFLLLAVITAALQCMMVALVEGPVLRVVPNAEKGGFSGIRLLLSNIGTSSGVYLAGVFINHAAGIKILYFGAMGLMELQLLLFVFGFERLLQSAPKPHRKHQLIHN